MIDRLLFLTQMEILSDRLRLTQCAGSFRFIMAFMIHSQVRHAHIMALNLIQHLALFAYANRVLVVIAIRGFVWL